MDYAVIEKRADLGGQLVYQHCVHEGLQQLALSRHAQPTQIKTIHYDDLHRGHLGYEINKQILLRHEPSPPPHAMDDFRFGVETALGVRMDQDFPLRVPQLQKTDWRPMAYYNPDKIQNEARRLPPESMSPFPTVIIFQSGSSVQKRFAASQVLEIASHIKRVLPNCHITWASDRTFVLKSPRGIFSDFPFEDPVFKDEISTPPKVDNGLIDFYIEPENINALCAIMSSRKAVGTDSFWAWLWAGNRSQEKDRPGNILHKNDGIILHTVAHPLRWGIPGIHVPMSHALRKMPYYNYRPSADKGMLEAYEYVNLGGSQPYKNAGIYDEDLYPVLARLTQTDFLTD